MKKVLMIAGSIGLIAVLLFAVHSYGLERGHGRHGMAQDFIMWRIDQLGEELNLNAVQKAKWDAFKSDLEARINNRFEQRNEIHEAVQAELSKDNPDLSKITPLIHSQIDEMSQFGHDLVNRISELYADLTPEQKKKVSGVLEEMHKHHRE